MVTTFKPAAFLIPASGLSPHSFACEQRSGCRGQLVQCVDHYLGGFWDAGRTLVLGSQNNGEVGLIDGEAPRFERGDNLVVVLLVRQVHAGSSSRGDESS